MKIKLKWIVRLIKFILTFFDIWVPILNLNRALAHTKKGTHMQNIVIEVSEKVQKYLDRYVTGLIVSTRNRSCVNISNLFDVSHDVIRKVLLHTVTYAFPRRLLKVVATYSINKRGWLIIDDTSIMKRFILTPIR